METVRSFDVTRIDDLFEELSVLFILTYGVKIGLQRYINGYGQLRVLIHDSDSSKIFISIDENDEKKYDVYCRTTPDDFKHQTAGSINTVISYIRNNIKSLYFN